jgi:23S rRNA U2552 (ribose-2'-O)-methylase RlmE/FtsJ
MGRNILARRCLVSVDLFEIAPIEGCTMVKGDITREKTV